MERVVRLPLYGDIDHPAPDLDLVWELFQSKQLSRLRDVSLSSSPSRVAAYGMAASRFDHSVGVCYLARKLCERRSSLREHRDLLMAASLCHDIGSPPFSHISEIFFYDATGLTHEQKTKKLLQPEQEIAKILTKYQVNPQEVAAIITGEHKLSPLIAGSMDLDNVDNSIHLLVSLGYHDSAPYHPMELLKAFRYRNEQVYLDASFVSEIAGWQKGRRMLYDLLHSETHLAATTMLYRALEYAYYENYLDNEFFDLDESDAIYHLRHQCSNKTSKLIERALNWQHHHLLYQRLEIEEDPRLKSLYDDWRARKQFTDRLAKELNIKPTDFSLYVGKDRGEKPIDLPFIGERAELVSQLFEHRSEPQRLSLFATAEHARLKESKKISKAVQRAIDDLPIITKTEQHVFF